MDWKELQSAAAPELHRRLAQQREQLRDLRFRVSQGTHKDVAEIGATRKVIARLLTRIKQLERETKS